MATTFIWLYYVCCLCCLIIKKERKREKQRKEKRATRDINSELQQSYSETCVQALISLHATQAWQQQQQVLQSPALRYIGHVFTAPDKTWQEEARRGRNGNLVLVVLTRDMLYDMSERCQRPVAPFEAPDWLQLVCQVLITTYKHSYIHHCGLAITPSKGAACHLCG